MTDFILPILFFIVALIYSSVGLGGGSAYTAILAILGIHYLIIPTTSLTLNLVVTSMGMVNFWRNGHGRLGLILPFMITSIPMAYFAGTLELSEHIFHILLLFTLALVAIRMYFLGEFKFTFELSGIPKWSVIFSLGAVLGFVAGAVGIGGGIYLVPLIIMFGLGTEKEAAGSGPLFIWGNSLAGLIARTQSGTFDLQFIFPLAIAVSVGGFTGSYFGSFKFNAQTIQKIMGVVIIIAIMFLFRKIV
ncbi:MAG: sulfite exporter TauE/SafE family protein [Candidatus Marinimicrobia bacterium]|nr:sulfite exporter TauE/SafE family protein [Candidatus Neomarinimicrobiota bacterium]